MESYLDFIPQDLIIEILGYSDLQSADGLSKLKSIYPIYVSKNTWGYLLSRDYPQLYKSIKTIKEDTVENMKMIYYTYKDNIKYRNLIEKNSDIKFDNNIWASDRTILDIYFFKELTEYPILLKILIYINYPGNYDRIISIMNLDIPLEFNYDSGPISILRSLKYASRITIKDDIINKYLKGEEIGEYPSLSELDNMSIPNDDFDMFQIWNYVFIWLYVTDPNMDINKDFNIVNFDIGATFLWMYNISAEFNKTDEFIKLLGKLTPINLLEVERLIN